MKRKVIVISILAIIASLSVATVSNAAIQIKPTKGNVHTEISASQSYQYCYDMRNASSSLGVNNLDPHLTLNKDWGAAAYLAISAYGIVRSNSAGNSVTIDNYGYFSTTGNGNGIMNMGNTRYVYTASMGSVYEYYDMQNIIDNKNTKYVEIISSTGATATKGCALGETQSWYNNGLNNVVASHTCARDGILGAIGTPGNRVNSITFRPVIWNK